MIVRLCLALAVVAALSHASALDRARYEEMVDQIEEEVEDSEERNAFIDAVGDYLEIRDDALLDLVELVKSDRTDATEDAWNSIVSRLARIPVLEDVDDDLESEAALDLYEKFMDEEQEWVEALSVLSTAEYRDILVFGRVRLENMTTQLEEKWNGILNDDGRLDERELRVMADIYGVLARLASESDTKRQSTRNAIQVITDLAAQTDFVAAAVPGPIASAVSQATGIIAEAAKQYNEYRTAVEQLRPQLRELSGQELGLLIGFNETRADTQLFVNENNYDLLKDAYGEAIEELEHFEDVGTSGQREDTEVFVRLIVDAMAPHLERSGDTFNSFVAKHNLKFFGPVGPDIRDLLVETSVWLEQADSVSDLDLERLLSAWRSDANAFFGVSLSGDGITDEERRWIEDQLRNDLATLQRAIDDAGQAFSTQNLMLIYDRREINEAIK